VGAFARSGLRAGRSPLRTRSCGAPREDFDLRELRTTRDHPVPEQRHRLMAALG
jgi:hypothetical protein